MTKLSKIPIREIEEDIRYLIYEYLYLMEEVEEDEEDLEKNPEDTPEEEIPGEELPNPEEKPEEEESKGTTLAPNPAEPALDPIANQSIETEPEPENIPTKAQNPEPIVPPSPIHVTPTVPNKKILKPKSLPILSKDQAVALIKATKGKMFTVSFIKRTDGLNRIMTARLGVKKYLRGGSLRYDPVAKNLIPVFDVRIKEYRMIAIEGLTSLTINKQTFKVN
jgi:hypothetical protein